MTNGELVQRILDYYPPISSKNCCDGVKYGNLHAMCTGIAVTCFANIKVIRRAAELGCSFIYCHEPTFWEPYDNTLPVADDPVFLAKTRLLDQYGITVFRDHDRMHARNGRPDWIEDGIADGLGWRKYRTAVPENVPGAFYELPPMTLGALCEHIKQSAGLNGVRYIGDPSMTVSRVWHCAHLLPEPLFFNDQAIRIMEENGIDVLLPLDTVDWTALSYVRDASLLGCRKGAVLAGHFNMEEMGMRYLAKHLKDELGLPDIPVRFVQSGDMYRYA